MAQQKITDEQLREEVEQGLTPAQIAAKYGLSRQAVTPRLNRMQLTTTALAVAAPLESRRFVASKLNAIEELVRSFHSLRKLMDACEEWLQDPDNPDRFDINPRSEEIVVHYWEKEEDSEEPRLKKAKASLATLLRRIDNAGILTIAAETRVADPRQLLLATSAELRQTIAQASNLMMKLADARAMQVFMNTLLEAIREADEATAQRVAEAVDDFLTLYQAEAAEGNFAPG